MAHTDTFCSFSKQGADGVRGLKGSKGEKVRGKKIIRLFSHNKAKGREDNKFSYQCGDKAQCLLIVASLDA